MGWFLWQSAVVLVPAFGLGVLVGWLAWGRRRGRAAGATGEDGGTQAAVRTVARRFEDVARDREVLLADQGDARADRDAALAQRDAALAERDRARAERDAARSERDDLVVERDAALAGKDAELAERDNLLSVREAEVQRLRALTAAGDIEIQRLRGLTASPPSRNGAEAPNRARVAPDGDSEADPDRDGDPTPASDTGQHPDERVPATTGPTAPQQRTATTRGGRGAPRNGEDDLERIEGIGPRIATALRDAGIRSFRQLANSEVARVQSALEASGLRFAPSLATWSQQAALLAAGDEEGFAALTATLVAARQRGGRS